MCFIRRRNLFRVLSPVISFSLSHPDGRDHLETFGREEGSVARTAQRCPFQQILSPTCLFALPRRPGRRCWLASPDSSSRVRNRRTGCSIFWRRTWPINVHSQQFTRFRPSRLLPSSELQSTLHSALCTLQPLSADDLVLPSVYSFGHTPLDLPCVLLRSSG